jgi:hypothetical protein
MKLYWRYKKEGKWTWMPAKVTFTDRDYENQQIYIIVDMEEEE